MSVSLILDYHFELIALRLVSLERPDSLITGRMFRGAEVANKQCMGPRPFDTRTVRQEGSLAAHF